MEEVELTGETIEEIFEKLENNNGKQIRQHFMKDDISIVLDLIRFCKFTCPMGDEVVKLFVRKKRFDNYEDNYELNISPNYPGNRHKLFLLIEEETETFEEMTRRKQEEIFRSLK